jgi:hypothetical protein
MSGVACCAVRESGLLSWGTCVDVADRDASLGIAVTAGSSQQGWSAGSIFFLQSYMVVHCRMWRAAVRRRKSRRTSAGRRQLVCFKRWAVYKKTLCSTFLFT